LGQRKHFPTPGCAASEACQPGWWINRVTPPDAEWAQADPAELVTTARLRRKYRMRHNDGTYRWVRDVQRLLLDDTGQALEIIGSWMDITERKHLEEQLRQAQKNGSRRSMAGGVAMISIIY